MTNPSEKVAVEQVDREAACKYYGYDDEKDLVYWGNVSKHNDVEHLAEAFARHRLRTPEPTGVERAQWTEKQARDFLVDCTDPTDHGYGAEIRRAIRAIQKLAALSTVADQGEGATNTNVGKE